MITETQKRAAQGIVNVFETGKIRGDYGAVAVIPGDTGHLSYGRSQVTLGSGSLSRLLAKYVAAPGATYTKAISTFLLRVQDKDFTLDHDASFKAMLKHAGDDPVMHQVQDDFFDEGWWKPALVACAKGGIVTALGTAIVYDSHIQGSWPTCRDLTDKAIGPCGTMVEQPWITRYCTERKAWLAGHKRADLRATVYRPETFMRLIDDGRWDLALPFTIQPGKMKPRVFDAATLGVNGSA